MVKASKTTYLSLVLPVFNEEEALQATMKELYSVCNTIHKNYEIIFVDDCSRDRTPEILKQLADNDPRVKILRFSRNFGHQAALSAGIDVARGELVVTMDSDLQHPPRLIPEFIKQAERGSDIVIGERISNQQNSFIRETFGKAYYKFLSSITDLEFKNVSDFALYKKPVIKILKQLPEKERYLRGMIQWVGFKKTYVPYITEARKHGQSKYSFKRLFFSFFMSGITSFSAFPLRLAFWAGLLVLMASILFSGYVVWDYYANPDPLNKGNATIIILMLFLGSLNMIVLGILGEYFYKMFNEVKGRPLYIVAETKNIENDKIEKTPYGIHNF
ncbi:MAG: glycosyltransferase family 2 protein [bacterium]|nr:glycosyltransferase family 2 protein [bacterium]